MDYYYSEDGNNQIGPVSLQKLQDIKIGPRTLIWREGLPGWVAAEEVEELKFLFTPSTVEPIALQPVATTVDSPSEIPLEPLVESPVALQPLSSSLQTINYQTPQIAAQGYRPTNGLAIASMIMGIFSLLSICCFWPVSIVFAILAVIFGYVAKSQCRQNNQAGEPMAMSGLIMGFIVLGLFLLLLIFFIVMAAISTLK